MELTDESENQSQITAKQISQKLRDWVKRFRRSYHSLYDEDIDGLLKRIDSDELFYSNSEILDALVHFLSSVDEPYIFVFRDTLSLSAYPPFLQLLSNTLGAPVKGSHNYERSSNHRTRWQLFSNISAIPILYRSKEVQKALSNFIRNHGDHGKIDMLFLRRLGRVLYMCESDDFPDIMEAVAYCIRNSRKPGEIINQIISEWKWRTRDFKEIAGDLERRYLLIVKNPIIREAIKERILTEKFPYKSLSIRDNDLILNSNDFALSFARKIRTLENPSNLMFSIIRNPKYGIVHSNVEFQKSVKESRERIARIIRTGDDVFWTMCNAAEFPQFASSKSIQNAIVHRVDDIVNRFWEDLDFYYREVGSWFEDFISLAFREYKKNEGTPCATPGASLALIVKCPYLFDTPRVQEEYNSKQDFKDAVDSLKNKIQEYNRSSANKH